MGRKEDYQYSKLTVQRMYKAIARLQEVIAGLFPLRSLVELSPLVVHAAQCRTVYFGHGVLQTRQNGCIGGIYHSHIDYLPKGVKYYMYTI